MKQVPVNINVKFDKEWFHLATYKDQVTSPISGIKIYLKMRPGNEVQPMAIIPDETLNKYMHCRPKIVSCDWVSLDD